MRTAGFAARSPALVGDLRASRSYAQRVPAAVGDPASVDRQTDTVDEPLPIIIGEKGDRRRDVFRPREARHRYTIDDVLVCVRSAALVGDVHLGLDPARTDSVDTNPAATPFGGQRARESDQTVF